MVIRVSATVAALLAFASMAIAANTAPLTPRQWREDLNVVHRELEQRHPNPYHHTSKARLDAAFADLDRRIPELSRNQIIVGMMRIIALVGDGHTRIDPRKDEAILFASLPLKLYDFDDGIFIRAAMPKWAGLIGWRVDAIGGVPIAEAQRRVGELVSADNEMGKKELVPLYLEMPAILQALGLSSRHDVAVLTLVRGKEARTVTIPATQVNPPWPADTDIALSTPPNWIDACHGSKPLYLQAPLDAHRLIYLPEKKALYAQLNWVTDTNSETLEQFGERILAQARTNNPKAIILDLRLDQGGNGTLANRFVPSLIKAEGPDTSLFVIAGRGTFSASQFILNDLDRLTDTIFVGEPASSKPSSYGDAYKTELPNSGINMRSSIYWWQDGQNFNPYTWIDVAAPLSFADYAACRDPALEAVLAYHPPEPLEDVLFRASRDEGIAGANAAVRTYLAAPANRYSNVRTALPRAAELVLRKGHKTEALLSAEAVADALPNALDAWVVLAFVALQNGNKSLGRTAADRALALDPNDRTARSLLDQASDASS
jgi:hypothetical protein